MPEGSFLGELAAPVSSLRGVGPKTSSALARIGVHTLRDLLLRLPRDYLDRTRIDPLAAGPQRERINCIVEVTGHRYAATRRKQQGRGGGGYRVLKVMVRDRSAEASLICFGRSYLRTVLTLQKRLFVSGSFRSRGGEIQSSNFEFEILDELSGPPDAILPIYTLTEGVSQGLLRKLVRQVLDLHGEIACELPSALRSRRGLPERRRALRDIHFPGNRADLEAAWKHFIYHELFYLQVTMKRRALKRGKARAGRRETAHRLCQDLLSRLPFRLTRGQKTALAEIEKDLESDRLMCRLLQGDVGCGKTLVALMAAASVVEAGEQVAIMAPTELLAHQHAEYAAGLLEPLGVRVGFLTGAVASDSRRLLLGALAEGAVDVLVGTHALFSEDVRYRRLGLVVVDEQQRFGVRQRRALIGKGVDPDLLLMTATPIPRTLALTAFGDLDVSSITTMPAGRKPVTTHLTRQGNEHRVYGRVRHEVQQGRQAYFVYPLIESSDRTALKAAEEMYALLRDRVFPDLRLALIHSRVPEEQKRRRMVSFVAGRVDILVATSVLEVGVDVPNATCMVVEHAERFGLSALHQLRGRVGRSERQSYAFLIYSRKLTEDGVRRLQIMMETTDGFRIAAEDLAIRGPGELLGTRQAGFLRFLAADLSRDTELLLQARDDVTALLTADPGLLSAENRVIGRVLSRCPPFDESALDSG